MASDVKDPDSGAIEDADNPEWTDADFARAVPFAQLFPEQAAALKRQGGRPRLEYPKVKVAWRLSADVVEHIKATGKGYHGRVDAVLKAAIAKGLL